MKVVNIALLGFGTVGTGVFDIIRDNSKRLTAQCGARLNIKKILVLDIAAIDYREVDSGVLTERFADIIEDDTIDIVVEVTGTVDIARDYMTRALQAGKHVVTANKHVIARWGQMLFETARNNGCSLYYEATVGGGIPIIREFSEGLAANQIESFYGILNGTTNYILWQMAKQGVNYKQALQSAQQLGYAESDPTGDVKGHDAANKLAILAMLAFDLAVNPEEIDCEGIDQIDPIDISRAQQLGYQIKLLAIGKRVAQTAELAVTPALVPSDHILAGVGDSFNGLLVKGNAVGDVFLYGRGAGSLPTGSAIVGDVLSLVNQGAHPIDFKLVERYQNNLIVKSARSGAGQYYLRVTTSDIDQVIALIEAAGAKFGDCQIDGDIALTIAVQNQTQLNDLLQRLKDEHIICHSVYRIIEE